MTSDNKELDEFIKHVNSCAECYEELEVYYTLLTAMSQLDENEKLSYDFGLELSEKIEREEERIIHERYSKYRKRSFIILGVTALALFIGSQTIFMEKEEENLVTDSDFRLRTEFYSERYDELEDSLMRALENNQFEE